MMKWNLNWNWMIIDFFFSAGLIGRESHDEWENINETSIIDKFSKQKIKMVKVHERSVKKYVHKIC